MHRGQTGRVLSCELAYGDVTDGSSVGGVLYQNGNSQTSQESHIPHFL